MANYIVADSELSSIAGAIREKTGASEKLEFPNEFVEAIENISNINVEGLSVTQNGTYTAPSGKAYSPVNVNVQSVPSVPAKEVNFRDYDGTVLYSYTPAEFAALEAMPANPDHSGDEIPLTSQGWNWSFADAQAYVAKYGRLEVGQMYIPTDGKTHVLIHLEPGRTSPLLGCCPNGTVDVDWGDGTAHDTLTGTSVTSVKWTPTHNYAAPGDYDIKLTCTGTMGFYGEATDGNLSALLRATQTLDNRNIAYQGMVQAVFCGQGLTTVGDYSFCPFYDLKYITFPNSVNTMGSNIFQVCVSLVSITIPQDVVNMHDSAFTQAVSLRSISMPKKVSNMGINLFRSVYRLRYVTIPESVTTIETYTFLYCYELNTITIPKNVGVINQYTFYNCYGMKEYHFTNTIPPTLANTNAFGGIASDCVIYVPRGSLNAYKTATNWSAYASYMQEETQ